MDDNFNSNPLVCFFDSGIGGLNLLSFCVDNLAGVDFIYYADNYNMPYGAKSKGEIISLMDIHMTTIASYNPQAVVLACNTVTAVAAKYLREKYPFPIIGIQPAVKPAAKLGKCVVLSTPATASSSSITELINKYGENRTEVVACPHLAHYIEENIFNLSEEELDKLLPNVKCDSIVLGCTHYSFIYDLVQKKYSCPVFDGIEGTSRHLFSILGKILHQPTDTPKIAFLNGNTAQNRSVFNFLQGRKGKQIPTVVVENPKI